MTRLSAPVPRTFPGYGPVAQASSTIDEMSFVRAAWPESTNADAPSSARPARANLHLCEGLHGKRPKPATGRRRSCAPHLAQIRSKESPPRSSSCPPKRGSRQLGRNGSASFSTESRPWPSPASRFPYTLPKGPSPILPSAISSLKSDGQRFDVGTPWWCST